LADDLADDLANLGLLDEGLLDEGLAERGMAASRTFFPIIEAAVRHRPALDRATQYWRAFATGISALQYWIPACAGMTNSQSKRF
jgi:hypothetical protein